MSENIDTEKREFRVPTPREAESIRYIGYIVLDPSEQQMDNAHELWLMTEQMQGQ